MENCHQVTPLPLQVRLSDAAPSFAGTDLAAACVDAASEEELAETAAQLLLGGCIEQHYLRCERITPTAALAHSGDETWRVCAQWCGRRSNMTCTELFRACAVSRLHTAALPQVRACRTES